MKEFIYFFLFSFSPFFLSFFLFFLSFFSSFLSFLFSNLLLEGEILSILVSLWVWVEGGGKNTASMHTFYRRSFGFAFRGNFP